MFPCTCRTLVGSNCFSVRKGRQWTALLGFEATRRSNLSRNPTFLAKCSSRGQQQHDFSSASRAKNLHSKKNAKYSEKVISKSLHDQNLVRLSKRMSELDICSRREADRFILEKRVMVGNSPVAPILGQKVSADEINVVLLSEPYCQNDSRALNGEIMVHDDDNDLVQRRAMEFSWCDLQSTTVVLHKPLGYVSGQPEDAPKGGEKKRHIPAVRLLTRDNAHIEKEDYDSLEEFQEAKDIVKRGLKFQTHHASRTTTLTDYVPAGRLDLASSGVLIFTSSGVMAKKLISRDGLLEKEYLVLLEPVQSLTRYERQAGMAHLSLTSPDNTARMLQGGHTLWGEHRPLKPAVEAEWLSLKQGLMKAYFPLAAESCHKDIKALRIVLKEGRKHQIRRMCRELLGMHVVDLVRTRIGNIELGSIPEGKWRPLRQHEAEFIYNAS